MSWRRIFGSDQAAEQWVRTVNDELEKLRRGDYRRGAVSFDSPINIGGQDGVDITVAKGGGTPHGVVVTLTNRVTGTSAVIATLP